MGDAGCGERISRANSRDQGAPAAYELRNALSMLGRNTSTCRTLIV